MAINSKYIRTRRFARLRHGKRLVNFVGKIATALSATPASHTVSPVHASQLGPEATLTISGGSIAAAETVTLGSMIYKFVTALTEAFASVVLTSDNTNASDGDTVTIGTKVYTLQGTLTNVDGHVHIGTDADGTLLNLARAINASGGTAGTDYATLNTVHPTVASSAAVTAHAITLTAKASGTAGNAIASTETSAHLSFATATLLGGVAASAFNEVVVGNGTTGARDNLIAAITASGAAGKYQSNIVANPDYTASASSANVLVQKKASKGTDHLIFSSTAVHGVAGAFTGPFWTATSHGITPEGAGPYLLTNSGGALPTGSPALGTELFVHVVDANTIAIAVGRAALRNQSYFGTSSAGTGTQTLKRSVTNTGIFDTLKRKKPRTVAAATDIDGL